MTVGAPFYDVVRGILGVDVETTSTVDLTRAGAWAYSCDPTTNVYVVSFGYTEQRSEGRWATPPVFRWTPGRELPRDVVDYLRAGGRLLAHNAGFEIAIWSNILVPRYDFPPVGLDQWEDSQARGNFHNLPMKLEGLAAALGSPVKKDAVGHRLMLKMARSRVDDSGAVVCDDDTPENRERLAAYCDDDVRAMLGAWHRLAPLTVTEQRLWRLDREINARGVFLDVERAAALERLADARSARLAAEAFALTAAEVADAAKSESLKTWLVAQGVELPLATRKKRDGTYHRTPSADKKALLELLDRPDLGPVVRRVLLNRAEATKATSLAKLGRVSAMVTGDGRLRGALQFHAASTGRWSSTGLQIHNLPKDKLSKAEAELVELLIETGDLDALELCFDRPLQVLSQKLRSVIAAPPGRDLVAADYSSIEACVCAWLAGEEQKVEFLHDYFAEAKRWRRGEIAHKPQDLYEFAAAGIGSDNRQLGKVAELALQYGMGDLKFFGTAADWGVPIPLKLAAEVKRKWRASNVMIVRFWKDAENAVKSAIRERGVLFPIGEHLATWANKMCLFVRLPSGRCIRYWQPSLAFSKKKVKFVDAETGEVVEKEVEGEEIRFLSQNEAKTGFSPESTYGGKLVENFTQAVARDILGEGLLAVDAVRPYDIVMHVHDSIAAEVPAGAGDVEEFSELMARVPSWAAGCPIAADGYRARRFRG